MINASTSEKVQLVNATREIGLMTTNEQRECSAGRLSRAGDERIISLNYIKQSDMSKYQTGQEPQEDPGNTGARSRRETRAARSRRRKKEPETVGKG